MFVCVECGHSVPALFNSYGKDNIVLERCVRSTNLLLYPNNLFLAEM